MEGYYFVVFTGLFAGIVSGVIGTGSSMMLLPVLVFTFGPKEAVPIMAIAALLGNITKVLVWWRDINYKAFIAYTITGAPAAAIGARTLWSFPSYIIDIGLGIFFLIIIPIRYKLKANNIQLSLIQVSLSGAFIGYLTGLILSTGPLSVPVFTSYGLVKGSFISTESASSLVLYISKVVTFNHVGALSFGIIMKGIIVGVSIMLGTFVSKFFVLHMSLSSFNYTLDIILFISGISCLLAAI